MKAADVWQLIESHAPISSGVPGDELGLIFGDPEREVTKVATCWSPTLAVIRQAANLGCEMIVSHEPCFFRKRWSSDVESGNAWFDEAEDEDKEVNRNRRAALERHGIVVYRAHSNWDSAPEYGVIDALVETLGLGPAARRGRFTTVHEVEPRTVGNLADHVQEKLNTGPIRVIGDLDRTVTRVATMIGGLGQMFNAPEEPARLGAEAIVAGECLAYTCWCAEELGVAIIEAGHCATENPGVRAMARFLNERLDGVEAIFLDTSCPWTVVGDGARP